MKTIKFSKMAVILAFIMCIAYTLIGFITGNWPPSEVTFCWYALWGVELIASTKLKLDKRTTTIAEKMVDAVQPYINEDNAEKVAEKLIGVELKRGKNGNKK